MEAQGRQEVQLLLILDLDNRWRWVVSVTLRSRFTPGKELPVPIIQEAGWAPEPVWTQARGKILLPLPGIKPQSPGRSVRSQTLHWLSYPGSQTFRYLPETKTKLTYWINVYLVLKESKFWADFVQSSQHQGAFTRSCCGVNLYGKT
jgi:hypothetical protein